MHHITTTTTNTTTTTTATTITTTTTTTTTTTKICSTFKKFTVDLSHEKNKKKAWTQPTVYKLSVRSCPFTKINRKSGANGGSMGEVSLER